MGESDSGDGLGALSDALAGLVVMVLVLLCPYATYKFIRWANDGGGGHDDLHRGGIAGIAVAAGAAKTAGSLAMQVGTGTPAPQGPAQVPGAGADGVVTSGINPTGAHLSREGIDGTPNPRTAFRYGEDPDAPGDKGRALIQRPGIPPLITRPTAASGGSGGSVSDVTVQGPSASGTETGGFPGSEPPATGSATPPS
jgi:hypothetical protein